MTVESFKGGSEDKKRVNLVPLGEMTGARRALESLIKGGSVLDKEAILRVLRGQRASLSAIPDYEQKAKTLGRVITEIEEYPEVPAADILKALKVEVPKPRQGFNFGGLFHGRKI